MATLLNQEEEKDEKGGQSAPQTLGGPQSPSVATSGPQAATGPADKRNVSSGRFTNVQKYIQANQGGVNKLGQEATQRIGQQLGRDVKQQTGMQQQFQSGVGQAQNVLGQGAQFQEQVSNKAFDPTSIANDPNQLQQFSQFRTGAAVDEASLQKQQQEAQQRNIQETQKAADTFQGTRTEQGRSQMLRDLTPKTNYSLGQQRLDQLFLQKDKGALGNIRSTVAGKQAEMQDVGKKLATGSEQLSGVVSQEKAIQDKINEQLGLRRGEMASDVQNRFEAEKQSAQAALQGIQSGLSSGQLTQQQYDSMFKVLQEKAPHLLSQQGRGGNLYGMDLSQLAASFSNPEFDISKFASQQDVARRNALASLSGIADADTILNLDEQMAGQYQGPINLNVDQANELFRQAENAYIHNIQPYAGATAQVGSALSRVNNVNQQLGSKANELTAILDQMANPNLGLSDKQALGQQAEALRQQMLTDYANLYSQDNSQYFTDKYGQNVSPTQGWDANRYNQSFTSNTGAGPQLNQLLSALTNYSGTGSGEVGDMSRTYTDTGFTNLQDAGARAQAIRSLLGSSTGLTDFDEYLKERQTSAQKDYDEAAKRFGYGRTLSSLIKKG